MLQSPLCCNSSSRHFEIGMLCPNRVHYTLSLNWNHLLSQTIHVFSRVPFSQVADPSFLSLRPKFWLLLTWLLLTSRIKSASLVSHHTCGWCRGALGEEARGMMCFCCRYVKQDLQQDKIYICHKLLHRLNEDILLKETAGNCSAASCQCDTLGSQEEERADPTGRTGISAGWEA